MEIRLIVNGNLVHTMSMPKLQLISSKNDIFFATTAPEFFPNRTDRLFVDRQQELQKLSPPSSPNGKKINTKEKQLLQSTKSNGKIVIQGVAKLTYSKSGVL
jgi:hypothetical protein